MNDTFELIGRDMYLTGLVSSHAGSLSIRDGDRIRASRRGAMLGRLSDEDLIEFGLEDPAPDSAPDEMIVHQAIYRQTDAKATMYARPPWTMALSLVEDRLAPANDDGAASLGTVPVLISQRAISSPDIAQMISRTLRDSRAVALRGHGVFVRGDDLGDALRIMSLLEEMCKVVHIYRSLVGEEPQPVVRDRQERPQQGGQFRGPRDGVPSRQGPGRPQQQRPPGDGQPRRNDGANRHGPPDGRRDTNGRRPPPHR